MKEQVREPGTSVPGFGPWKIAGTPVTEPYPCRCHESRRRGCSPMWCPCSGRVDYENVQPGCCAERFTPEVVTQAKEAYERKRREAIRQT